MILRKLQHGHCWPVLAEDASLWQLWTLTAPALSSHWHAPADIPASSKDRWVGPCQHQVASTHTKPSSARSHSHHSDWVLFCCNKWGKSRQSCDSWLFFWRCKFPELLLFNRNSNRSRNASALSARFQCYPTVPIHAQRHGASLESCILGSMGVFLGSCM